MEYFIILGTILLVAPIVLPLGASQKKAAKNKLRKVFAAILVLELISGLFGGYSFALTYTSSFMLLFFAIAIIQLGLVWLNIRAGNLAAMWLNLVNTVVFFIVIARLSNILGYQLVNFFSISAVFLVLIGNLVSMLWVNKDKNLMARFYRVGKYKPSPKIQKILTWVLFPVMVVFIVLGFALSSPTTDNQNPRPTNESQTSSSISREEAAEIVNNLPEVQDYLDRVPNGRVDVESQRDGVYNVHVYEIKDGHTATFNWYEVDEQGNAEKLFEY